MRAFHLLERLLFYEKVTDKKTHFNSHNGGENDSITNRKSTRNGKKLETKEVVKEFMEAST